MSITNQNHESTAHTMEVDTPSVVPAAAPAEDVVEAPQDASTTHSEQTQMTEKSQIRSNAVHVSGVDDLSTKDLEKYITKYYAKPFSVEWIDDTSLNVVYEDPEDAYECLIAVTANEEFERPNPILPEEDRNCKPCEFKPEAVLKVRFALASDRKSNKSREKSRYYLLHGAPSRKEDLVRFGTKRTAKPMMYGDRNSDIVSNRSARSRLDDLFPSKDGAADGEELDDLIPHRAKASGGRRSRNRNRRRGRNGKESMPDLFANKIGSGSKSVGGSGPIKADSNNKKTGESKSTSDTSATSAYQNMDY